jgi:hypothetical protein
MVRNPNSSNSDKSDDIDCCKEFKEYYCVTKQDCEWIKCPFCEKWVLEKLHKSVQNLPRLWKQLPFCVAWKT